MPQYPYSQGMMPPHPSFGAPPDPFGRPPPFFDPAFDQGAASLPQDSSVAMCVAFQMAAALVRDRLFRENKEYLNILKERAQIILLDMGADNKTKLVLEALGVNHQVIMADSLVATPAFPPSHTAILCGMSKTSSLSEEPPLPRELVDKLIVFIAEGGQLISFNCAIDVIQAEFPNTLQSTGKHALQKLPTRIAVNDNSRENLFSGYEPLADCFCVIEQGAQFVKIPESANVEVLCSARELKKKLGYDAAVSRFKHEKGYVVHFVSSLHRKRKSTSI